MGPTLKRKVDRYRQDGRNLFSHTEKIVVALCCPELYQQLMPQTYQENPMSAYFRELDGEQRIVVMNHHCVR